MKHMSDCFDCCICACGNGGCLAGIGDNDFSLASKEELIRRLDDVYQDETRERKQIKETLKTEYQYDYDIEIIRNKYGDEGVSLYRLIKTWLVDRLKEWHDKNFNGIKIIEDRIVPIIALALLDGYKEFKEGDK